MHTEVWYYFVIPQVASQSHLEKRTEVTELWISVPDFVLQLWRKIGFFPKAARQNPEWKAWV